LLLGNPEEASMAKRSAGQRDRVTTPTGSFYAKRTASGQFKEMDEVGKSQKADRRTKAKTTVKSGHGDQGDQKRTSRSAATKKR
jgi:hypothetical protein